MSIEVASNILAKYEDDREYHFYKSDRDFILEAMCEYANYCLKKNKKKNKIITKFAKKYDLGEFRFIEYNVIDFTSRYTFTYEEIKYALKHFLTFDRLLERQKELIKKSLTN